MVHLDRPDANANANAPHPLSRPPAGLGMRLRLDGPDPRRTVQLRRCVPCLLRVVLRSCLRACTVLMDGASAAANGEAARAAGS